MGFFSLPPKGIWSTIQALGDIVEVDLVQWGNSEGDATLNGTKCQHGPPECKTMRIYACQKYASTPTAHAQFVECFDQALMKGFPKGLPEGAVNMTFAVDSLQACATAQGLDYKSLDTCSTSSEGEGYFAKEKALTDAAGGGGGHKGVPFVTINGGAIIYNSQSLNLIDEVCKAYTGSPKPKACGASIDNEQPDYSYTSLLTEA